MSCVNYGVYALINCLLPEFSWEALAEAPMKRSSSFVWLIGERIKTQASNQHELKH